MKELERATPLLLAAAAFLTFLTVVAVPLRNDLQRDDTNYRLDDIVEPSNYKIEITPQFQEDKPINFVGKVVITATIRGTNVSELILHVAKNIEINSLKVFEDDVCEDFSCVLAFEDGSTTLLAEDFTTHFSEEFLKIEFYNDLQEDDKISINIEYEADFPEGLYGFYISKYKTKTQDGQDNENFLLTTHFQPTHARKAFPCFDEPRFKATFEVALVVPEGYNALGNTAQTATKILKNDVAGTAGKASRRIEFLKTPIMSTYLVAFIVYNVNTFAGTTSAPGNLPFRTWGRASEINAGAGALSQEDGPKFITAMEQYTGISYRTYATKVDQAAIPDLTFGAMENWGLVTYRELRLLYDKSEHTQVAKKRISEIIAHELTHQWFGNLVTTAWWDTTWLNEGFATLFEYYLTNEVHPEWRMDERLIVDEQLAAFAADATATAPPLTATVNSPEEIINHFGTITYSKGGSVLRMFRNILGEDNFQTALGTYLRDNALTSVTPENLFNALTKDADVGLPENVELADIFESWTTVAGFPVIHVSRTDSKITFTQERFFSDGSKSRQKYNVNINLVSNDADYTTKSEWFLESDRNVVIEDVPEPGKWVLVNSTGYFRVNYDNENWELLTKELRSGDLEDEETITPLERAMLLDNALNLARARKLSYSTAIQLMSYLQEEVDYIPWSVGFSSLSFLHRMLGGEKIFEDFVQHIIDKVYNELEFQVVEDTSDEKHIEHVHRANVLSWACRVGHIECRNDSVDHLRNYLEEENSVKVAPDLRSIVYCYGAKNDVLWTKMWDKLGETDDVTERSLLLSGLGCSSSASTLYMYLESAMAGEYIGSQDTASVFSAVYSNTDGVDVALDFLNFNIRKIVKTSTPITGALPTIVRGIAPYLKTEKQKKVLQEMAAQLTNEEHKKVVEAAISTVNSNMAWITTHRSNVLNDLQKALLPTVIITTPSTTTQGAWALRPALLTLVTAAAAALALAR